MMFHTADSRTLKSSRSISIIENQNRILYVISFPPLQKRDFHCLNIIFGWDLKCTQDPEKQKEKITDWNYTNDITSPWPETQQYSTTTVHYDEEWPILNENGGLMNWIAQDLPQPNAEEPNTNYFKQTIFKRHFMSMSHPTIYHSAEP